MASLQEQIETQYPLLGAFEPTFAYSYVHEIIVITISDRTRYALKLYRAGIRSADDLNWETSLHNYLFAAGAPVVELITGRYGPVQIFEVDGVERFATLTKWAPGSPPGVNTSTFHLLGRAAAQFHQASQGFSSNVNRDVVDLDEIVDRPLAMLKPILQSCSRWEDVVYVATSLRRQIAEVPLDWGICHNDLGLRNVHVAGDQLLIFDLDGSTEGWRALEAVGVYEAPNRNCWPAWLAGYRGVRTFSLADEHAVPIFTLLAQLQRTAWKLGLTDISVGQLMTPEELPIVVDEWLYQFEQIQ